MTHKDVQQIAKNTMQVLAQTVCPGMTERELADIADKSQREQGIVSYWYHGLPALLFAGERTILSQSADEYDPTDYAFKENDIITIDLSPEVDGVWADYARTLVLQDGKIAETAMLREGEFRTGLEAEDRLHAFLVEKARPDMSFSQLHTEIEACLTSLGYKNLDFLKNFGHSIAENVPGGSFRELENDGRIFFDAKNHSKLSSVRFFTFEPHISRHGGKFGYKREDIYAFENGRLTAI